MARYMVKDLPKGSHVTPENGVHKSYPPCRPEDYYSNNATISVGAYNVKPDSVHMFQRKSQAFLKHKENHEAMRYGQFPDYDPKCHQIIERWKDQYARRGQSTFCKTKDDILGG